MSNTTRTSHNTTKAELIEGIRQMDAVLDTPARSGLTRMRKAALVVLHTEVLAALLAANDAADAASVVKNVQVDIVDLDTDDAVELAADVARQAMIEVGMPVGPTTPVQLGLFGGSYLVDLPAEDWWTAFVESGDDFWAETGNVAVTVSLP